MTTQVTHSERPTTIIDGVIVDEATQLPVKGQQLRRNSVGVVVYSDETSPEGMYHRLRREFVLKRLREGATQAQIAAEMNKVSDSASQANVSKIARRFGLARGRGSNGAALTAVARQVRDDDVEIIVRAHIGSAESAEEAMERALSLTEIIMKQIAEREAEGLRRRIALVERALAEGADREE